MRQRFSREFKLEAVRLMTERGVAVAQACRDLDLVESVLRRGMRGLAEAPSSAFPVLVSSAPSRLSEQAEIAALEKEVTRLRAERDRPQNGPQPSSRGGRREVRLHGQAPAPLGGRAGCAKPWTCRARAFTLG